MAIDNRRTPSGAKPARMGALARLPVFLSLDGKRAVVAGGSAAAAWKAELLSASGARVEVYATDICDELLKLADDPPRGTIVIHRCTWSVENFEDAAIAVGAFEDEESAAEFAAAARAASVPVNVIDR